MFGFAKSIGQKFRNIFLFVCEQILWRIGDDGATVVEIMVRLYYVLSAFFLRSFCREDQKSEEDIYPNRFVFL